MSESHTASASHHGILLLGATGTIGAAAARAFIDAGYAVTAPVREASADNARAIDGLDVRVADVTDAAALARDGFRGERFDAVVSCLASRTGVARDAWAIDHRANANALAAAQAAGTTLFVLLSAICVQKPKLAFQQAKLAFEQELAASDLAYVIVRPTAFFKSLSGQLDRLRAGKPYLMFGNGALTACKPISDRDLAKYLVKCVEDETLHNRILPIGGPGPAVTPHEMGEKLFALLGREPKFAKAPPALLAAVGNGLSLLSKLIPPLAEKAELAKIGHYYGTESMLVWDEAHGRYDADATPSSGEDRLFDHYAALIAKGVSDNRGDHAVF